MRTTTSHQLKRKYGSQPWKKYGLRNVWEMLQDSSSRESHRRLSSGCMRLDSVLGGGLLTGGITDVCGESSCGKSQFCMQLALQSILPERVGGLRTKDGHGTCLYICTEGRFPSKRFVQLASHCLQRYRKDLEPTETQKHLMDRVLISELLEPEEFWPFLHEKLPILVRVRHVRLLIVDSITGICRGEVANNRDGILQRSRWLHDFTNLTRCLASTYGMVIVTVNQVTALFEDSMGNAQGPGRQYANLYPFPPGVAHVKPALGLLWTSCVNARIMLHRSTALSNDPFVLSNNLNSSSIKTADATKSLSDSSYNEQDGTVSNTKSIRQNINLECRSAHRRYIRLIMSPAVLTNIVAEYAITEAGIIGVM